MEAVLLKARMIRIISGSKRPVDAWKQSARVYSEQEATAFFTGFNVAAIPGNDLVFIDIEGPAKKTCANGWQTISGLQQAHGALPYTVETVTPSGGGLLIFKSGGRRIPFVDLSASHGLEMRTGDDRYCLLPPSVFHSESYSGRYHWKHSPRDVLDSEGDIPVVPDWLVQWFLENQDSRYTKHTSTGVTYSLEGFDLENYAATLEGYLQECHSDIPEPDWFAVLAACHRAGERGLKAFLDWSESTGGSRWKGEETRQQVFAKWHYLTRTASERIAAGEPLAGLGAIAKVIAAQTPPAYIELKDATKDSKENDDNSCSAWPLLPLPGTAEEFRLALKRSMPWQDEALYAIPLICLQAVLQRRVVYWKDGLTSHWWAFIGGPASNKTTFKDIVAAIISRVNNKMILDTMESQNGIRSAFADYPSRILILDEGLKQFNAVLESEAGNKANASLMGEILNKHNSKSDQQASTHKKKEDRIPFVKLPQLMIVTFDQSSYWNTFCSSQAVSNGLLSRFFMLRMKIVPVEYDARQTVHLDSPEFDSFADSLRRIANILAPLKIAVGPNGQDDHNATCPDVYGTATFSRTVEANEVFREFNNSFVDWARQSDERVALLIRAVEGAKLLAQLCAAFDSKQRVMPEHARIACGIAARSLRNIALEPASPEEQIIAAAVEVLNSRRGGIEMRDLVKALKLPTSMKKGKGSWTFIQNILRASFTCKGNVVTLK